MRRPVRLVLLALLVATGALLLSRVQGLSCRAVPPPSEEPTASELPPVRAKDPSPDRAVDPVLSPREAAPAPAPTEPESALRLEVRTKREVQELRLIDGDGNRWGTPFGMALDRDGRRLSLTFSRTTVGERIHPSEFHLWDLSERRLILRKALPEETAPWVAYDPFRDVFWVSHESAFFRIGRDGSESPPTRSPMTGFLAIRADRDGIALRGREGFVLHDPAERTLSPIFQHPVPLAFDLIDGVLHIGDRQGLSCMSARALTVGLEQNRRLWSADQVSLSRLPGHAAVVSGRQIWLYRPDRDAPEALLPESAAPRISLSPDGDAAIVALDFRTQLVRGLTGAGPYPSTRIWTDAPPRDCTFSSDSRRAAVLVLGEDRESRILLLNLAATK